MDAIRIERVVKKDGEIVLKGLPYKKGDAVEMILLAKPKRKRRKHGMTAGDLLKSDIVGMWKNRADIQDSADFARTLRERATHRED